MGGRPGVQQLRHVSRAVREGRQPDLRRDEAVRRVVRVRREHAFALGHAGAVQQHHAGLGVPGRPARSAGHRGRQGDGLHLRRLQGRNGYGEQGLHRDHDRRRCERSRLPVPNPHVLHHARLRLERNREQPAAVRNDLEVRHSVLLQLHQLRHGTVRRAFHVLPPAPRPARAAQEVGRFLRQRRVHGLHRRGHHQHAAPGLSVRRRSRLLPSTRPSHGRFRALAAHEARSGHAPAGCGSVPVHQALPGHVREPLLHDRPGGHERGVPERSVAT